MTKQGSGSDLVVFFLRQFARPHSTCRLDTVAPGVRIVGAAPRGNGGVRRGQRSIVGLVRTTCEHTYAVLLCTHPQLGAPAQVFGGIHFLG